MEKKILPESPPCVFCRIIEKTLPARVIYEDGDAVAFLTQGALNLGHALVVPRQHVPNLYEMRDETTAAVAIAVKKVAIAVKKAAGAAGVNIIQNNDAAAGQAVFHAHFHVIPRHEGDGYAHWHPARSFSDEEQDAITRSITNSLAT